VSRFRKPANDRPFVDFFDEDDVRLLLEHMSETGYHDARLKRMVMIGYECGLRLSEIIYLQKECVVKRNDAWLLMVRNTETFRTKSGQDRMVPLSNRGFEVLMAQIDANERHESNTISSSPFVFPSIKGTPLTKSAVANPFRQIVKSVFSEQRRLRFHSLRHGFGTRLARNGVSPVEIQAIMGHSSVRVTEPYFHFAGMSFQGAMKVLNSTAWDDCTMFEPRLNPTTGVITQDTEADLWPDIKFDLGDWKPGMPIPMYEQHLRSLDVDRRIYLQPLGLSSGI
jgi:integrase